MADDIKTNESNKYKKTQKQQKKKKKKRSKENNIFIIYGTLSKCLHFSIIFAVLCGFA